MTIVEYNEIVKRVNNDSLERSIYMEIERYCKSHGIEVYEMDYNAYVQMRDVLFGINKNEIINRIESGNSSMEVIERKARKTGNGSVIISILVSIIFVVIGLSDPTCFVIFIPLAMIVFSLGIVDSIPYSCSGSAGKYIDKVLDSHENAMLNTRAYIAQAYIHSGSLRILKDRIEGKK